ncbi:hypothetical protein B0H14DRAFT_3160615 [Mycena olivaceomarginata]|nr:hypothetical protein B0H14DRAFT_3160615 [Mycena olivaceomarginata]
MTELIGLVASLLQLVVTAKLAIEVAIDVANAPQQQRDLLEEVESLKPLLEDLHKRLQANQSTNGLQQLKGPFDSIKEDDGTGCLGCRSATTSVYGRYISLPREGTGTWLFEDLRFKDWVSGNCRSSVVLRNAGINSTNTMSMIVDNLRARFPSGDVGVACAYLNHKETDVQSPQNILAGLWRQFIIGRPIFSGSPAHELYLKHREQRTRPSMEEVHAVLRSAVAEYAKVYILIDALDEYPENQRYILLEVLATRGLKANLIVTSRPHITVDSTLFPNMQALEIRATEEDIHRYLDGQIERSFRLSKHIQTRPELRREIETEIITNID